MPNQLHKNAVRQKSFTYTFNGNQYRQSNADSTSYLGIVQNFVSGVPDLNIDAGVLPLTFGGVADGTERVDSSQNNDDRWVVNCMNHTDDNHVYDPEDVRDSALAALNNTTWHNFASGLDFTPTQLGTWTAQDEVYATHTTYDLTWTPDPLNTTAFADDHPVGINPQHTIFLNVSDTYTPTQFTTDFSPLTAILDVSARTVTLGCSSASNMVDNSFFAVGSKYGTGNDGTQIPQWIGTVKSRTIETDGSATIVLDVDSGLVYLAVRAAEFLAGGVTENNIEQLFTTGRHFVVLINNIYLYMIDQINTANEGYTVEGNCTEADFYNPVSIGSETKTYNILDITVTAVTDTINNLAEIQNIPDDVLSSTKSAINQIRIRNNNVEKTFFGGTRLFVQVAFSAGETPLARLTKAVAVINNSSDVELTASISGTDNNATLRLIPRNTTITWGTATYASFSNWTGSVATSTADVTSPVTLAISTDGGLTGDANRIGTRTGITLIDTSYVSRTTDYEGNAVGTNAIPNLTFARGSSLTLGSGFTLDIGKGYDFTGDGKDIAITIEENAKLVMSGQAKEGCWGGKQIRDENNAAISIPRIATAENPITVTQRTGGSLLLNINPELDAPVTGDRTFLYGNNGAQVNNSIQWIVDNGSTGFYNSAGYSFVYTMPGAKKDQLFVINSPSGSVIYVPVVTIKQFTADTIYLGEDTNDFQFSASYAGTNATDILAGTYSSIWLAIGMKLLGNTPSTLEAYNPTVNYMMIDTEDKNGIYTGDWNFNTRPTNSKGIIVLGRLWNPSWRYGGEALTGVNESYYYGTGADKATLVAVKEGCEPSAIGTAGANNHPFNSAISISDDYGLASTQINADDINNYKSQNLTGQTFAEFGTTTTATATSPYVDLNFTETGWVTSGNTGVTLTGFTTSDISDTNTSKVQIDFRYDGGTNVGTWDGETSPASTRFFVDRAIDNTAALFVAKMAAIINDPASTEIGITFRSPSDITAAYFNFTAEVINDNTLRLVPKVITDWTGLTLGTGTPTAGTLQAGFTDINYVDAGTVDVITVTAGVNYAVGDFIDYNDTTYECITAYTTTAEDSFPNSNTNWEVAGSWGDGNSDRDGLVLTFTKGTPPPASTTETNINLSATQYDTDWFCYSRRDGYRPRVVTESFGNSLSAYQPVTAMDPFLDGYWQADTVSAIDAYVTKFLTSLYSLVPIYTLGTTLLDIYLPESETWNQIYRYIEHCENNNRITNANLASETRPFNVVNGRFDRFIDRTTQVTVDGAINMPNNNLKITVNGSLIRSTDSNAINGIDVGTTKTIDFHSIGSGSNVIKGDLTAKGFTFTETFNTLSAQDSTFNNTDAQDYTIALSKTVVNSAGAPTFSDLTEEVTVNTDAKTTIDAATADMITVGNGAVEINANSNDGRYGTAVKRPASITYSSSAVSTNDTGYASGDITLPNASTDAFINSGGDILRAGTTGITTDADLTATGSATLNVVDGGSVVCGGLFRAHSSVTSTTIQATGNVTIDASATNSSGIGINGNAISILGNTVSCEVNAVTTFSTNDVTSGSDVSAGTSATMDVIDNSKVASPIVGCDYIQNEANVDATTSIDVDISMTGGTADSATINIDVDLTGGTATASGTLTVPLISGAQTTANAGKLVATTLTSGFVNFSGNGSTIANINGGIIGGAGNLTTTNRITGGDFGANITLLSVPTNTPTTRHTCGFADTDLEMTNSGIVEFSDGASGVATITKGPSSGTTIVRSGGVAMTIAADNGSNNTDNVEFSEDPFTITFVSPTSGSDLRLKLTNGTVTSTLVVDAALADRGDVIEYAYRTVGSSGFAMKYGAYTVPSDLVANGSITVDITATLQPYPRSSENPQTQQPTATVGTFANSILPVVLTYAVQNGPYMNKILCEAIGSSDSTFLALFSLQDDTWFGSDGSLTWFNANSDNTQVTSTTATTDPTAETLPYFRPTNSSAVDSATVRAAQYKLGQGTYLGQSYDISPVTPADVANEIIDRLADTINGMASGIEDSSLSIPADDIDRL